MSEFGPRDGSVPVPEERLLDEMRAIRRAGNDLAAAAHRVQQDYDGVHRLRLALAGWYTALANEWGRGGPSTNEGSEG